MLLISVYLKEKEKLITVEIMRILTAYLNCILDDIILKE